MFAIYIPITIALLVLIWCFVWLLSTIGADEKYVALRPRLYGKRSLLIFILNASVTVAACTQTENVVLAVCALMPCVIAICVCISATTTKLTISGNGICLTSILSSKHITNGALFLYGHSNEYIYFPDLSFHSFKSADVISGINKYNIQINEDVENLEFKVHHLVRIAMRGIKFFFWLFSSAFYLHFVDRRKSNRKDA